MLEKINHYLNDNIFCFTVYEKEIHIQNASQLITLEDNYISLKSNHKKIMIHGSHLVLKKMLEKDILIMGNITNIEVEDD